MGTILVSAIFTECDGVLLNANKSRWGDAEKLRYLNAAQRQIVLLKPSAYTVDAVYRLVAGTKQTIPDGTASFLTPAGATISECIQLIKVVRNMGTTGLVAGSAITPVGEDILNGIDPDWHLATAAAVVQNYIFDERAPLQFYVTPPQPTSSQGYIEAVCSAIPTDVETDEAETYEVEITLSDVFRDIITNYILFRCYAKDAAISPYNAARAAEYWNLFVLGLERKDLVKREYSPNVKLANNPSTE